MKILFMSYGIWEFDGRLRELVKIAKGLGDVRYITRVQSDYLTDDTHIKVFSNVYLLFIIKCIILGLRSPREEVFFIDNRKAILPVLILKMFGKKNKVILDVRELYLIQEVNHKVGKIGCIIESKMIKSADIVISANEYRSIFMQQHYQLKQRPFTYENLRKLEYTDDFNEKYLKSKYTDILTKNKFQIITTAGFSTERLTDRLVECMKDLNRDDFQLLVVGGGTQTDKDKLQQLINTFNLNNVYLIDKVKEDELKYLIRSSDLGVVTYHQKDMNNKLCASGKIFEYLFEEIPVITTTNQPLKEFCEIYSIGYANEDFIRSINEVRKNYNFYKTKVKDFISEKNIRDNNNNIVNLLKSQLSNKS